MNLGDLPAPPLVPGANACAATGRSDSRVVPPCSHSRPRRHRARHTVPHTVQAHEPGSSLQEFRKAMSPQGALHHAARHGYQLHQSWS